MTSAWLTTAYVASVPSVAFQRSTAATARALIAASPSPPGKTAADGRPWTTAQSGSLRSVFSSRPVQSP